MAADPGDKSESGPVPYAGFRGHVGLTRGVSTPWWESRKKPSADAPNVVIVVVDDLGYSDFGCYGSEIPTPNIDRICADGLQFTNFHVTPLCSPSRAALLTGINHHRVGVGQVIEGEGDTGFPGYRGELSQHALTTGEIFRDNGYTTLAVGKWHVTGQVEGGSDRFGWPLQRGFDRYYGTLGNITSHHAPASIVADNHVVVRDSYPSGYHLTDDLTDQAIAMISDAKAESKSRPFLLYFAHTAVHAPLHANENDIAPHRGKYAAGWDLTRQGRFAKQVQLGLFGNDIALPPRNAEPAHDVPAWDALDGRRHELFARYMELYAAMVAGVDRSVGRLRAALEQLGEWDNTLVLILSDNGASQTGGVDGTSQFPRANSRAILDGAASPDDFDLDYSLLDEMGGANTFPAYPRGWAMVSNTPFRLYKMTTHAGGHQVPLIVSWPTKLRSGELRRQYCYVTDLLPTLVDLCHLDVPATRSGLPVMSFDGRSLSPVLADEDAPGVHPEQYYEMWGNRAFYSEPHNVVTLHRRGTSFGDDAWEVHDIVVDPTEAADLADLLPDVRTDLIKRWTEAAWQNQVFPLDERIGLSRMPRADAEEPEPVVVIGPRPPRVFGITERIGHRSFVLSVEGRFGAGNEGIVASYGDAGGGIVLYAEEGDLRVAYNYYGELSQPLAIRLPVHFNRVGLRVSAPGEGIWLLQAQVDECDVGESARVPICLAQASVLDVGLSRISPVDPSLHGRRGSFPYTGEIGRVLLIPGGVAPDRDELYWQELRERAKQIQ